MKVQLAVFLLIAVNAPGLPAQELNAIAWRLSFSTSGGIVLGGPTSAIVGYLRDAGLDDTRPRGCGLLGCSGPTDHPARTAAFGADLSARYEISRRWAVSATVARLRLGDVTGYRAYASPTVTCGLLGCVTTNGESVESEWRGSATWIAVHLKPFPNSADRLSIGGGLTRHAFEGWDAYDQIFRTSRYGLVAEASLRLPQANRIFYGVTLRAHILPGSADVAHSTPSDPVILRVTWSYLTAGVSVGLRL